METTQLILVTPAATVLPRADVSLSYEGIFQADRLGERLSVEEIAAVYTSPMMRARQTAGFIASPHFLRPIEREGIRETGNGVWEARNRAACVREILTRHPGKTIVIVSHRRTLECAMRALLGPLPDDLDLAPASLTTIVWSEGGAARLERLNDTSHYGVGRPARSFQEPVASRRTVTTRFEPSQFQFIQQEISR